MKVKALSLYIIFVFLLFLVLPHLFTMLFAQDEGFSLEISVDGMQSNQDMNFINGKLYISDGANKSIYSFVDAAQVVLDQPTLSEINPSITLASPNKFALLSDGTVIWTEAGLRSIYIVNKPAESGVELTRFANGTQDLPIILNVAQSALDDIYMITQNQILSLDISAPDNDKVKVFYTLSTIYDNGAFFVDEENKFLYFSVHASIYKLDLNTKALEQILTNETFSNVTDFTIDNFGNYYILDNGALKVFGDKTYFYTSASLNPNKFAIDLLNGIIYLTDGVSIFKEQVVFENTNIITSYSTIAAPVEVATHDFSAAALGAIVANASTSLYTYPTLISPIRNYTTGASLVLIQNTDDSKFFYALDTTLEHALCGYVLKSKFDVLETSIPAFTTGKIVVAKAKVFSLPFSNLIGTTKSPVLAEVNFNENLNVLAAPAYPTDFNGVRYYAVTITENNLAKIGYIDTRVIINSNNETLPEVTPPNATLKADTNIFGDSELKSVQNTLQSGAAVTILSKNNDIAQIKYSLNNVEYVGYVHMSFLDDGRISITQIIGIVLICVSIIVAILLSILLSHQNKKKKEELIKQN